MIEVLYILLLGGIDASALYSSSLDLSGNLNQRRYWQRNLYTRRLISSASRGEVGESGSVTLVATSPSWTQRDIGLDCAFVLPTLSSSNHESMSLNAYLSGTEKLENTIVAATRQCLL